MSDASDSVVTKRPPNLPPNGGPPQPPKLALRSQAPGVRSSVQAPVQQTTLRTGEQVGNRFVVDRYLGSSGGGISYLCTDKQTQDTVVVKILDMPFPGDEAFAAQSEKVRVASLLSHRNLTRLMGIGRMRSGEVFMVMEFVEGTTLSQLVAQNRSEGRALSIRDTFTVLAHVCNALTAVHAENQVHGVLTPYNVYVDRAGVVKVGNLAFSEIVSEYMHGQGEGPFVDSIYVAPEVSEDPNSLSARSDVYSLGMMAAELLNPQGLPNDRKQAGEMAIDGLSKYPPSLFTLITQSLSRNPAERPSSAAEFRASFEEIAREVGAKLDGLAQPGSLPIEPAVGRVEKKAGADEDDLFGDIFALAGAGNQGSSEEDRYLVQKGGLDYGPFTEAQLIEQLHSDDIDENSLVLDRITQERIALGEMSNFVDVVKAYIPVREDRLRREAAARAELQRKVKQGGKAALVVGIIAGLIALGAMLWFWSQQPEPESLALDSAFASLGYNFLPPPQEFQAVAVDNSILQSIFNPQASEQEIANQLKRVRSKTRRPSGAKAKAGAARGGGDSDSGVAEVDMSASGSDHYLSDHEINEIVLSHFGHLRGCMMLELKENRSFKGVTVQFFIRPSGTTGGVQIKESRYANREVGECLIQRFRAMKFPEHGAISNRGVTYPFYIQ